MTKPTGFILFVLVIAFCDFAFAQGITPPAKGAPPAAPTPPPQFASNVCTDVCARKSDPALSESDRRVLIVCVIRDLCPGRGPVQFSFQRSYR